MLKPQALPEPVRPMLESGYWKVTVRPSSYVPDRIPYARLRETLDRLQVRLRGWYFPHLSNKSHEIQHGTDYYGTWVVFTNYEYWRFYESSQLIHYQGIRENIDEMYNAKIKEVTQSNLRWAKPDWSSVSGYIDIINFLYTVTEVFEFAARLSRNLEVDGSMEIDISLRNIDGYILGVSDWGRAWDFLYRCTQPELSNSWSVEAKKLDIDSAPYALEAVKWFCERFGWHDANMAALKDAQSGFMKRRPA